MARDYYSLLGIYPEASESEIRRAYRKVALKYHPDKNPTEEAAEVFHELSVALETLTTASSREQYDRVQKAEEEKRRRTEALDSERRKLKEDLEARERNDEENQAKANEQKRKLEQLKMEGYRKRRKYQEQQNEKLSEVTKMLEKKESMFTEQDRTVKVKWSRKNGGDKIMEEDVKDALSMSYGTVDYVVITPAKEEKKLVTALVVFKSVSSAYSFVKADIDRDQDLFLKLIKSVKWAGKEPNIENLGSSNESNRSTPSSKIDRDSDDYTELTLLRLQQAEKANHRA